MLTMDNEDRLLNNIKEMELAPMNKSRTAWMLSIRIPYFFVNAEDGDSVSQYDRTAMASIVREIASEIEFRNNMKYGYDDDVIKIDGKNKAVIGLGQITSKTN
jgi:hypothetical protein